MIAVADQTNYRPDELLEMDYRQYLLLRRMVGAHARRVESEHRNAQPR